MKRERSFFSNATYSENDITDMRIADEDMTFKRTSANSVEISWKQVFREEGGGGSSMYTLQELVPRTTTKAEEEVWYDVYRGGTCRWELVGITPDRKYYFRVISDTHCIVSRVLEVALMKEVSTMEMLSRAISCNDNDTINRICGSKHPPNLDVPDNTGLTPLMRATLLDRPDIVTLLLRFGADANGRNNAQRTSAMVACSTGNLKVLKILVEFKANLSMKDRSGSSCIHYAVDSNNVNMIKYLIEQGADINSEDRQGCTPLMAVAAMKGSIEMAEVLVDAGADPNFSDNTGKTVLMVASLAGNREVCELLVEHGATHHAFTRYGKNAYEMAVAFDRRDVIHYFQELKKKRTSVCLTIKPPI